MQRGITRAKTLIIAVVIVAILAVTGYIALNNALTTTQQVQSVRFIFDFTPQGRYVAFYAALAQGYYQQQEISPTFINGQGSGYAITAVAGGKADLGLVEFGSFVTYLTKGASVKAVMNFEDKTGVALVCSTPVSSPKDLEGKSIASPPTGAGIILLPLLMKLNSVDSSKVQVQNVDPSAAVSGFLQGKWPCLAAFVDTNKPTIMLQAPNMKIYTLLYADFGLNFPYYVIVASNTLIQQNPNLIKGFIAATIKGVQYAVANPSDATNQMLNYQPALNNTITLAQWQASIALMKTQKAANSYGYMDPQEFKDGANLVIQGYSLNQTIDVSSVFSNSFVPNNAKLP